jgi:hypothetical protein
MNSGGSDTVDFTLFEPSSSRKPNVWLHFGLKAMRRPEQAIYGRTKG